LRVHVTHIFYITYTVFYISCTLHTVNTILQLRMKLSSLTEPSHPLSLNIFRSRQRPNEGLLERDTRRVWTPQTNVK